VFEIDISSYHGVPNRGSIILPDELVVLPSLVYKFGHQLEHQFLIGSLRSGDGWDMLKLHKLFLHQRLI